jgi:hypothetical protein
MSFLLLQTHGLHCYALVTLASFMKTGALYESQVVIKTGDHSRCFLSCYTPVVPKMSFI